MDHSWFWIETFGNRLVDDEITRITGITFDVTKAADDRQLEILIASGSLPDVVYTDKQRLWPKLANSKVSYDWGGLSKKYNIKLPATEVEISNAMQPDGKFYTIYNAYSPPEIWKSEPRMLVSNGSATLHIRTDIMEAIGNPKLESLDDFKSILDTVKKQYPKMDGLLLGNQLYGIPYFRYCYGGQTADTRLWYDEATKTVKYRLEDPNEKKMLAYINSLYRTGHIKPEGLIYEYEEFRQKTFSGDVFAICRSTSESNGANKAFEDAGFTGYKFAPVEQLLKTDQKAIRINDGIGWSGTYITKKCKNPEKVFAAIAFLRSPEGQLLTQFGIEGETWEYDKQGYPTLTQEVKDVKATGHTAMVDKYGLACWSFGISAQMEAVFNWNPQDAGMMNVMKNQTAVLEFRPWYQFILPAPGTELRDTYAKIGTLLDQGMYQIITAESAKDFEAEYNKQLKILYDNGLRKGLDHCTKQYPIIIKKY